MLICIEYVLWQFKSFKFAHYYDHFLYEIIEKSFKNEIPQIKSENLIQC